MYIVCILKVCHLHRQITPQCRHVNVHPIIWVSYVSDPRKSQYGTCFCIWDKFGSMCIGCITFRSYPILIWSDPRIQNKYRRVSSQKKPVWNLFLYLGEIQIHKDPMRSSYGQTQGSRSRTNTDAHNKIKYTYKGSKELEYTAWIILPFQGSHLYN